MEQEKKEIVELRDRIEKSLKKKMKTPADFEFLAGVVWDRIHKTISSSTLKRLWGYAGKDAEARYTTKTILSQFLGYKEWDDFVERLQVPEVESTQIASSVIRTQDLTKNQKIEVTWLPDRRCLFQYVGGMQFQVMESENSHLQVGDTFNCGIFILNEPLLLDSVVHNGQQPFPYIVGSKSGLTNLRLVE